MRFNEVPVPWDFIIPKIRKTEILWFSSDLKTNQNCVILSGKFTLSFPLADLKISGFAVLSGLEISETHSDSVLLSHLDSLSINLLWDQDFDQPYTLHKSFSIEVMKTQTKEIRIPRDYVYKQEGIDIKIKY